MLVMPPGTHRADHRQRALAGHDRGPRAVVGVQRFHDDRGSGAGGGRRGQPEVLRGHFFLLLLRHAVGPVPVQRVEDPAAGSLGDAGADVDVVPERGRTCRERQQPSLAGRYVTRGEVQQDQPYAGIAHCLDEPVHLVVRRHRLGERPPELNRVEPGGPRGRGPLQQRQFGKQDGTIDVKPQAVGAHTGSLSLPGGGCPRPSGRQ
jgi:hypothetical protein